MRDNGGSGSLNFFFFSLYIHVDTVEELTLNVGSSAGDTMSLVIWDEKDAIGKEKGKHFLGRQDIRVSTTNQSVHFEKGVELVRARLFACTFLSRAE